MDDEIPFLGDPSEMSLTTRLAIIRTIEAEKRTHLAELRTGIGILTIPMSLLTILIATSRYYDISEVFTFIIGLSIGIVILSLVGGYLVFKALVLMRNDRRLLKSVGIYTQDAIQKYCNDSK